MGICWGTPVKASQTPSTTRNSTPVVSNQNSNEGGISGSRSEQASGSGVELYPEGQILPVPNLRTFTFGELRSATRNFRSDTILGEGGFGRVFRGWIDEKTLNPSKSGSGLVIAVKKLNHESMQGLEEWQSEVNFLGRLSHPNLVKLLGYCWEDKELLLVYEYMQKGSLENHLFRRGSHFQPLSWNLRLKIAIGAARGLAFLHTSEKQIIYRDFKASNILLDSNYNAKLSDFGLAKNGPSAGDSHVTTRVMGTYGYAALEYVATGHLYIKSDVSRIRALCCWRCFQAYAPRHQPPKRATQLGGLGKTLIERKKFTRVMDPRFDGQYPSKGALQAAQLTLKCLETDPRNRPSMKDVVATLEVIEAIKFTPKESKNSSARSSGSSGSSSHSQATRHGQYRSWLTVTRRMDGKLGTVGFIIPLLACM